MKVAHIITGLAEDGAEMMLLKLLRCMERQRFESVVISLTRGGAVAPEIQALGIPVWRFGPAAIRELLNWRPDLLQGWMYHGNLAAQIVAALFPTAPPVIWNVRGSHSDLRQEKTGTALAIWLGARLSRLPRKIVNNSESSARLHEQRLNFANDRWVIIPNGFDVTKFLPSTQARREVRAELSVPGDAPLIGLIGRWHPMKDHANFVRAAGQLLKSQTAANSPRAYYLLAGVGVDQANTILGAQIREAGIEKPCPIIGTKG
jgi:glycosyltransferase involved in cell wall biosynthesis